MNNFGTVIQDPPDPAQGDFGKNKYCNQYVLMEIKVDTSKNFTPLPIQDPLAGTTNIKLSLRAFSVCQTEKAATKALLQVKQVKISDSAKRDFDGPQESSKDYKAKKEGICDLFSDIIPDGLVDSDDFIELGKDLINETNNIPGFSMADFMSEVCNTPGGGDGYFTITFVCTKNVGDCDNDSAGTSVSQSFGVAKKSSIECNKDIELKLDILGPVDLPMENITTPKAYIDPCKMSELLDCWKKAPEAGTGLGWGTVTLARKLSGVPTQTDIDESAEIVLDSFTKNCKSALARKKRR